MGMGDTCSYHQQGSTSMRNSTLEQKTPLRSRKGLRTNTRLKSNKGFERHTRLNPKSDRQRAKDAHWNRITNERCYELGFMCLWCHQPGQRDDNTRFDYLDGHHKTKRRHNIHTKKNCYIAHQVICHRFIEDNNVDVNEYPDKEAWDCLLYTSPSPRDRS